MNSTLRRHDRVKAAAEAFFGSAIEDMSFPGGEKRASVRLRVNGRSVIASLRPDYRRTHLEAFVLQKLHPFCDDVPECLGVEADVLFQADVGDRRLNQEIRAHSVPVQKALAEEAVAAIFRIHAAARRTDLHDIMPHLGNNPGWLRSFVDAVDILEPLMERGIPARYPRDSLPDFLNRPAIQFVKWDCRAGNAALDEAGRLRWFDFEYAGIRHGAEDFAWLIGDESWPVDAATMLDLVAEGFDPACGHDLDDYMAYLTVYSTLHCVQRLKLILEEVQRRGWRDAAEIVDRDDVGRHPDFAAQLCRNAAVLADRHAYTAPLVPYFETAVDSFLSV